MATGRRRHTKEGTRPDVALDAFYDRLFGAPLADFIATRKALAGELRTRGDAEAARTIAGAHKPTPTAWAVNQIALHHPEVLARLTAAAAAVRDAQRRAMARGDASEMRDAMRAFNARISEAVKEAKRALAGLGRGATASQLRRIARTLHAMPLAAPGEAEAVARGRLAKDLEPASDLSALGIAPPQRAPEADEVKASPPPRATTRARPGKTPERSKATRAPAADGREKRAARERARREERDAGTRERAREAEAREVARAERQAARERRAREAAATRLETRARAAADQAKALAAAADRAERHAAKARAAAEDAEKRARDARRAAGEARARA